MNPNENPICPQKNVNPVFKRTKETLKLFEHGRVPLERAHPPTTTRGTDILPWGRSQRESIKPVVLSI